MFYFTIFQSMVLLLIKLLNVGPNKGLGRYIIVNADLALEHRCGNLVRSFGAVQYQQPYCSCGG